MNEEASTIKDVIRAAKRVIRGFKRRRLYGPTPTPEEETALRRVGDILKALLDDNQGAYQDGLAELSALIHYNDTDDEEDEDQ